MEAFFVYLLKSSVCLILFYLFYKALLGRDTFHRFNRLALLGIVLFSAVIPLCRVTVGAGEATFVQRAMTDWEALLATAAATSGRTAATPLWASLLLWTYAGGALFFSGQFLYACRRMFRVMRRGERRRLDGAWLVVTPEDVAPFSWMRHIVISQKDLDESGTEICAHEMAHVEARHSWDLFLSQACILLHWFNPAAWLLKQELQQIHEFEADESLLQKGIDAKKYQLLLIKKAVGAQRFTSVASSLNHRSLKKRISMMKRRKSNPWARLKYLCVLPLAGCIFAAFARPEISRELEQISSVKFIPQRDTVVVRLEDRDIKPLIIVNGEEMEPGALDKIDPAEIKSVSVLKDKSAVDAYGKKGANGVVVVTKTVEPLVFVDGQEVEHDAINKLDPKDIESVSVLKDKSAVDTYGAKGKNGVILIVTKKAAKPR